MAENSETPTTEKKTSQRIQDKFIGARTAGLQSQLDAANTASGGLQERFDEAQRVANSTQSGSGGGDSRRRQDNLYNTAQNNFRSAQTALSGNQSTIGRLQSQIADPSQLLERKERDLVRGAQFGESVLGDEGLGRLGDDADIQGALERTKRESEQGLSSAEYVASRERANAGIDQATQGASRGLLARLQQAGVKGASAGSQLAGVEVGGMKAKANVERDIFLKSADVQRQSFSDFKQSLGDVKSFDLGQKAKETDIVLQSGLGFAQLGSAEKIAELQAEAQRQAASARASANSCWAAGSLVMMMDGSVKAIEQIKLGEMTRHGQVEGRTQHLVPNSIMVKVDGIQVVGSHPIKELETWIESKDSVLAVTKLETAKDIIVYDLITTMNRVEIRGESGFPYLFTDYNGADMTEENARLLVNLNNEESNREARK